MQINIAIKRPTKIRRILNHRKTHSKTSEEGIRVCVNGGGVAGVGDGLGVGAGDGSGVGGG